MFNVPSQFAGSLPFGMFSSQEVPFGLATLQADPNCVLIQDPSAVWGVQDFPPSSYSSDNKLAWGATKNVDWVQRNALIYTDDLTNAAWTKSSTSAPSAGVLQCSAATATHEFRSTTGPITPVVGQTYYLSCKAKLGTSPYVQIACFSGMHGTAYANFDLSTGAAGTSTACTPTITGPDGDGYYTVTIAVVATGTPSASGFRLSIQQSASDTRQQSWAAAGTETVNIKNIGLYVGSLPSYQAIGADWDTTYTANAIAAGYPISLWTDSAGTKAINSDNQPIGKMLDMKGTYTATQATTANQPKWRIDANGKAYIERDTVNDALPITLPTVLSDAQLGPELVTNGTFAEDSWWTKGTGWTIGGGVASHSGSAASVYKAGVLTSGKYYLVTFTVSSYTDGNVGIPGAMTDATYFPNTAGTFSRVVLANATAQVAIYASGTCSVDNISVREVTGTNVVYTAEGNVTLKDSGLILSGSYAPITPAADYGRIIMAADSRYDAKIVKYLDGKRGRQYSLGPELVVNGNFASGSSGWTTYAGVAFSNGTCSLDAGSIVYQGVGTSGKTYLISYDVVSGTTAHKTTAGSTKSIAQTGTGRFNVVVVCGSSSSNIGVENAGAATVIIDNISIREVLL